VPEIEVSEFFSPNMQHPEPSSAGVGRLGAKVASPPSKMYRSQPKHSRKSVSEGTQRSTNVSPSGLLSPPTSSPHPTPPKRKLPTLAAKLSDSDNVETSPESSSGTRDGRPSSSRSQTRKIKNIQETNQVREKGCCRRCRINKLRVCRVHMPSGAIVYADIWWALVYP
jgi:hypothetical protein